MTRKPGPFEEGPCSISRDKYFESCPKPSPEETEGLLPKWLFTQEVKITQVSLELLFTGYKLMC